MDAELKILKQKRGQIKAKVTRFETFLDTTFAASKNIVELVKNLELQFSEFDTCQSKIEILDQVEVLSNERVEFENQYYSTVSRAQSIIDEHGEHSVASNKQLPISSSASVPIVPQVSQVNLPLLTLPRFKGAYNEYTHFHDTFNSLINKYSQLDNIQKFHYLISCLDGDALNLVQSLEITEANYDIAWNLLKERYDNKRIIINSHLKSLCELPVIPKENTVALRNFLDSYKKDIRALSSLGLPVESWNTLLIYLLSSKLDFASKREWEGKIKPGTLPTLDDFSNFLTSRCHLLENLFSRTNNVNASNQQKKFSNQRSENKFFSHVATNKTVNCYYCTKNHYIYYCKDFLNLTNDKRYAELKRLNLCINCLRPFSKNHICTGGCKVCKRKHNTILHWENKISNANLDVTGCAIEDKSEVNSESINAVNISAHCNQLDKALILLGTANIYICNSKQQLITCRALLDSGSQSNFITSDLVKKLQLTPININLPISGIGESMTNITKKVNACIKSLHNNYSKKLSFLILDNITGNIPIQSFNTEEIKIPQNITLADPNYNESRHIDLLLGASVFYELLDAGKIELGARQPTLQASKVGWLITGAIIINLNDQQPKRCLLTTNKQIQEQLEHFWILEDTSVQSVKFSKDEQFCENHFLQHCSRDREGRFVVSLPLKDNHAELGSTYEIAKKRFLTIERKFEKDKSYKNLYNNFMTEYETLGHMTKLNDHEIESIEQIYYLPHHGVLKPSSITTKLRVVFDASAKSTTGISLNDILHVGPTIQDDLFDILLRFRKHNFVLKADIKKMYRQVNINPNQRNLQRVLWRSNPNDEISHYVLNTVTYGTAAAPFLAIRALQQAAIECAEEFPKASNIILQDFYVDDLITGEATCSALQKVKSEIITILKRACFDLAQWKSNNESILDTNQTQENIRFAENETVKTLGILWNPNLDTFQFEINIDLHFKILTKRIVLSIIGKIFDPLGIIGPIIIKAKIILQQLWKMKIEWDEAIPDSHHSQFLQFFHELSDINKISVQRHTFLATYTQIQLHGFTDASEIAYGVCIYFRSINSNGRIFTKLACSKSRVAPLKVITLPRLELCGALLLARLVDKITKSIKLNLDQIFLWTDSKIVLSWLAQEPSHWKIFVSNRVSEIQGLTNANSWRHVRSKDNPADIISRGCSPNSLADSDLWWSGPTWLQIDENQWPDQETHSIPNSQNIPDKRESNKITMLVVKNNFDLFDKYSTLNKLLRITAYCLRFSQNARKKEPFKIKGPLQNIEIDQAMKTLIKKVQNLEFAAEIRELKDSTSMSKSSKLISLNPFLDSGSILRVGGRLAHANLEYDKKFPILLPSKHKLTELIIRHEHERTLHGGTQAVLAAVRAKFWPIHAINTIKKLIRQCIICYKVRPNTINPIMGNLPASRVNPSRPFYSVGIDFAGPFLLKDGSLRTRKLVKAYVCAFICFSTKAIHLELAGDLTTATFMNTLKRFFARRGISKDIWSDNGLNFVGAANQMNDIYNTLAELHSNITFQNYLLENRVTWHFIPPRAPHFGGLWESAVKLAKQHLMRTIGTTNLNFEEFYTILTQIESIINSRPITPLSNDPNDLDILTPGHFLIGTRMNALPEEDVTDIQINRLDKYHQLKSIVQTFWKRWSHEYLHNLQQRTKWMAKDHNALKPGLMVLLKEDNVPPLQWKTGRIVDVYSGSDSVVRVVNVKTPNGLVKRAFSKVCVLPIET